MKLRVLGCSGGELPGHRTTCFLVDGRLAIDAGALTASLSLDELLAVDDIVLTHSHFDHVKDVPLLSDLLVGRRRRPVRVHASRACARTLRESVFNDELWPDFTRIPHRARPVIEIVPFDPERPFRVGPYRVSPGGTIDFPLCGKVKVEGLNGSSAADVLTQCLGEKYLKHPQVSVLVREYNSKKIFVFGEVQKPGTFPYDEQMSIIQAITAAGGFSKLASKNDVAVTRLVNGKETKIRVRVADIGTGREKNLQLLPGDIVFVPESLF